MWWRRLRWLSGLIALCALATCPIGWRACKRHARDREAEELLHYLVGRARSVYAATHQLPRTAAGPTPPVGACCKHGGPCAPDLAAWQVPAWQALGFTIDDPHRYSYAYAPTPDGGAVMRAVGDVDCNGKAVVVEVRLTRSPDGGSLAEAWARQDPDE